MTPDAIIRPLRPDDSSHAAIAYRNICHWQRHNPHFRPGTPLMVIVGCHKAVLWGADAAERAKGYAATIAAMLRNAVARGRGGRRKPYAAKNATRAADRDAGAMWHEAIDRDARMATLYAQWLAARDGIDIPPDAEPRVNWSHVTSRHHVTRRKDGHVLARTFKRARAVEFIGPKEWDEDAQRWVAGRVLVRTNIPNWDWDPPPPVEDTLADDDLPLAA